MKRIEKAVQDYKARYYKASHNEGAFYASDCMDVINISGGDNATVWDLVNNALRAGFMIGYRKAQRDYRKRQANFCAKLHKGCQKSDKAVIDTKKELAKGTPMLAEAETGKTRDK